MVHFEAIIQCAWTRLKMKFENVLAELDGFGRYQIRMILLVVVPRMTLPFHFLLNNFIAVIPSHHCNISSLDDRGLFSNLSLSERLTISIPVQEDGTLSSCQMFAELHYQLLFNSSNVTDLPWPTVLCQTGWVYDHSTFKSTLATEVSYIYIYKALNLYQIQMRYYILHLLSLFLLQWDLVCEKRKVNKMTATIFFMGVMLGAAVFGYISDRCLMLQL